MTTTLKTIRKTEIYPTKVNRGTANERITGYAVQFEGSDECIECHGGTIEENRRNAFLFAAAEELGAELVKEFSRLISNPKIEGSYARAKEIEEVLKKAGLL